mgnify:CR=1 FL=1
MDSAGTGRAPHTYPETPGEILLVSWYRVQVFGREDELLLSFLHFFREADPDIVALFQARQTTGWPTCVKPHAFFFSLLLLLVL